MQFVAGILSVVRRLMPGLDGRWRALNPRMLSAILLCAGIALTLSCAAAVTAKEPTPSGIHGHVRDINKAALAGVHVKAMKDKSNVVITTDTNADGEFALPHLASGLYDVTFFKDGFEYLLYPHVRVSKSQPVTLDITLNRTNGTPPLKQLN
jgi:hypothetical protein